MILTLGDRPVELSEDELDTLMCIRIGMLSCEVELQDKDIPSLTVTDILNAAQASYDRRREEEV